MVYLNRLLAATIVLCCSIVDTYAAETEILLPTGTDGTLALPLPAAQVDKAVLMIHGWSGSKNEVGDLYANMAAKLSQAGIVSLRVNIRGESERSSSKIRLTSTFESRVADANAGLQYLLEAHPDAKVGLIGFSYGGATALKLAADNSDRIVSTVVWSSSTNPLQILSIGDAHVWKQAIEQGEAELQSWANFIITREHALGMIGYDLLSPLKGYQGALLTIRGDRDFLPAEDAKILRHAGGGKQGMIVVPGADHIFNVLEHNKYADQVLQHTLDWFDGTL